MMISLVQFCTVIV